MGVCVCVFVTSKHLNGTPCAECVAGMRTMRLELPYIIQFAQQTTETRWFSQTKSNLYTEILCKFNANNAYGIDVEQSCL